MRAKIVAADALEYDYAAYAADRPWDVAGNLPYNIATPLLRASARWSTDRARSSSWCSGRRRAVRRAARHGGLRQPLRCRAVRNARSPRLHAPTARLLSPTEVESTVVQMIRRDAPAYAQGPGALSEGRPCRIRVPPEDARQQPHVGTRAPTRARGTSGGNAGIPLEQRGERLALDDFAKLADALAEH